MMQKTIIYDWIFEPGKEYNDVIIFNENNSFTESIILRLVKIE